MDNQPRIKAILLDIGGVFLTNGWGTSSRMLAAETFHFDFEEMNGRHRIAFDAYETGKMTLDEYLNLTVFYEPRTFSREAFKAFMYAQSAPLPQMTDWMCTLKKQYAIKTAAVNNEGRELNDFRVAQFGLDQFIDVFVSSSYVQLRKPDKALYQLAMDMLRVTPGETAYIDDRQVFVEVAQSLGIHAVRHISPVDTQLFLEQLGIRVQ